MPEHPGFDFSQVIGRTIVQLRVRPDGVEGACKALQFPHQPLRWWGDDLCVHWLGPDHWLLTSDAKSAAETISRINMSLSNQLFAALDMSANYACFVLRGPAARTVLGMGCGLDMHVSAFGVGHCTRTHFANMLLFIVAMEDDTFNLYVDRSLARYLNDWLVNAGEDPMTKNLKYQAVALSSEPDQ